MPCIAVLHADADMTEADQRVDGTSYSIAHLGVEQWDQMIPKRFERTCLWCGGTAHWDDLTEYVGKGTHK